MSNFPADLIADVLSRLPVKPLLRFRCVSKPWCALIDSPDFIKSHLNRSVNTKSNLSLILRHCYLCSLDFDSLDNVVELDHPLKTPYLGTEILGSCNGLLCLYNGEEDIALWNPSTRNHWKLPVTEIEFPVYFTFCQYIIYGFGYDSITDDYKVVRIVQFFGENSDSFDSEVKVYSLRSNSWRRIQDFPYYLRYKRAYGVLACGALHWVVSRKPESDHARFIAAVDLGTEDYRVLPQPEFGDKEFHMNVGELDGCLSIICNYFQVHVDVWVMKEYGLKDSWVKLYTVGQSRVIRSFEFLMPIAFSKSKEKILLVQDNKRFLWYDIETKRVRKINVRGIPDYFEMEVCVETLVPLNSTGEIKGNKQRVGKKNEQKKTRKKRDAFLSKGFKLVL